MDLIKQYIIQCISSATNSLRLSTQKIEVVGLLRELISNSEDLESDIKKMKTITPFSTLAIRLYEIYNFLTQGQVEMSRLSERFKEHSQILIKDLNHMLDIVNPAIFSEAMDKLYEGKPAISDSEINIDFSKRKAEYNPSEDTEREKLKEKIIMDEERDEDVFFQNYETNILKPIKPLDSVLKNLSEGNCEEQDLISFADILQRNADISDKAGFEIIANMHKIVAKALRLIKCGELKPEKYIIESMRACLIVIVAVVRGKEVDITNYLNRAEEFGGRLENIKVKENT
jgi:hypothetical protein